MILLSSFRGISFDGIPLRPFPGSFLALISGTPADQTHIQDPDGALGSFGDANLLIPSMIVVNIIEEVQVQLAMVDLVLTQPILTCLAVKVFLNDLNRFI
jgi:hypothetical protein